MPIKPDTFDVNDTHVGEGDDTVTSCRVTHAQAGIITWLSPG